MGSDKVVNPSVTEELTVPLNQLKILSFKEKDEWNLRKNIILGVKSEDGEG